MQKLTKGDVILFAAKRLKQPFSVEDLVVESWKLDKDKFGLDGFKDTYPSNNKVLVTIMGSEGLIKKGKLKNLGKGMLCVG